jgi:GT2 family glycosyltransferase
VTLPAVSVVVLNWNGGEATGACLRSLAAMVYPNLSIIVVDNASSDGSADELACIETIDLIRNRTNLGFTGGVNAGIRRAMERGADYVWLLNSDATAEPGVLGQLVAAAEQDSRIGLVSPVFHDPDPPHVAEFCLAQYDPGTGIARQTGDPSIAGEWAERYPERVVLLGTALLVRRALIETIGVLDDRFFAYVEDVDYSLRGTAAGFRNVAVPDAVVWHRFKSPVENPRAVPRYLHYYITRNYLLLWRKTSGRLFVSKAMLWFLRDRLMQLSRMTGDTAATDALLAGLWDGLRGIGGPYDPVRRMPAVLRFLLGRKPMAWIDLMDGRLPGQSSAR